MSRARQVRRASVLLATIAALLQAACTTTPMPPGVADDLLSNVVRAAPEMQPLPPQPLAQGEAEQSAGRVADTAAPGPLGVSAAELAGTNASEDPVGSESAAGSGPIGAGAATGAHEAQDVPSLQAVPGNAVESEVVTEPGPADLAQPDVRISRSVHDEQTDLWERLRSGFGVPDLDGDLVRAQERWYAARPDYVQRMSERGARYLFHILQEIERRGLPTELALLPFIESAFNPQALSSARASGIWQFMPSTGKTFALKQNVFRDDRRDVLASTRAALDYLEKLHAMFGDWHLAMAAYNWGEGNVARAITRNRRARKPTDYGSLRMPRETRHYVPKLQAVKNIIARPEAFGLVLPELADHPYFLSVPIERDIDVELAAKLSGLSIEDFRDLNPQMNKPVILAAGTPQVLLPYDNANRFVQELPRHRGPLASWTAWVAPKTLKPADAARQVGMEEAELRELNVIPDRMLIRAGSTLLVPRSEHREADVSEHLADNATMALAPDGPQGRRVSLKAGSRDSVMSVARRFGVRPEHVANWNRLDVAAAFRPGQTVILFIAKQVARPSLSRPSSSAHKSRAVSATRRAAASAPWRKSAR
jgi:membrane-bound lytic murein transglycosylase D